MDRAALAEWIERYERVWRTAGTAGLSSLFAAGVSYRPSPWREPVAGLDALAAFWEAERDGPDEGFSMSSDVIAVDGDVGVARVEVVYDDGQAWRDLWIVRLDADGRCSEFEEWPFAPTRSVGHD